MQLTLDYSQSKAKIPRAMSVLTTFQKHLPFHVIVMMITEVVIKKLNIIKNTINSTLAGTAVQILQKT